MERRSCPIFRTSIYGLLFKFFKSNNVFPIIFCDFSSLLLNISGSFGLFWSWTFWWNVKWRHNVDQKTLPPWRWSRNKQTQSFYVFCCRKYLKILSESYWDKLFVDFTSPENTQKIPWFMVLDGEPFKTTVEPLDKMFRNFGNSKCKW